MSQTAKRRDLRVAKTIQAERDEPGEDRELSVFEKALLIEWRRAKGWLPG